MAKLQKISLVKVVNLFFDNFAGQRKRSVKQTAMEKKVKKFTVAARVVAVLIILISAGAGYGFAWRTFVRWWEPLAWGVGFGLAFGPFVKRMFVGGLALGPRMALVASVVSVAALCYGGLMTVNYCLSDESTIHQIDVVVTAKYSEERTRYRRIGRNRVVADGKYKSYYLTLSFENGATRELPVSVSVYSSSRIGSVRHYDLADGFFGYPVFRNHIDREQ